MSSANNDKSSIPYLDQKLISHHKRLHTIYVDDCVDIAALSNKRCLVINNNCLLPYIVASDFVDYSKSIEKPLKSVQYANLQDAVGKFRQAFKDSVDRVANFSRSVLAKQSKNNSTYGFAILKDTSAGTSRALYEYYVPLQEVIASLKNPHDDPRLHEIITHWDQHLHVQASAVSAPPPLSKQVGCRKPGDKIEFLPQGKDRLYLARCYLYGSAVTMAPSNVEHPISWFRTNFPNVLNYIKLSLCAELEMPKTTQWVDNSITRDIETKVLPKVKIPPLLDSSKVMSHNDWKQHVAQLRRDDIMALHILPPFPRGTEDDINDSHVQMTEGVRTLVWSVLRGVQCCCSASLVFPPYRLKAYCSLTPSPLTSRCSEHVEQDVQFQHHRVSLHDPIKEVMTEDPSDFPLMRSTLPSAVLVNPPHPSICVLLPRHEAMWRFDIPVDAGGSDSFSAVKLQLFTFLHRIIFTCTNACAVPANTVLCPVPSPSASTSESGSHLVPENAILPVTKKRRGVSSKLKMSYEVAFRCNFQDKAPLPPPPPPANTLPITTLSMPTRASSPTLSPVSAPPPPPVASTTAMSSVDGKSAAVSSTVVGAHQLSPVAVAALAGEKRKTSSSVHDSDIHSNGSQGGTSSVTE